MISLVSGGVDLIVLVGFVGLLSLAFASSLRVGWLVDLF